MADRSPVPGAGRCWRAGRAARCRPARRWPRRPCDRGGRGHGCVARDELAPGTARRLRGRPSTGSRSCGSTTISSPSATSAATRTTRCPKARSAPRSARSSAGSTGRPSTCAPAGRARYRPPAGAPYEVRVHGDDVSVVIRETGDAWSPDDLTGPVRRRRREVLRGIVPDGAQRRGPRRDGPQRVGQEHARHVLMGRPGYEVLGGRVTLDGSDLLACRPGSGPGPGCSSPRSTRPRSRGRLEEPLAEALRRPATSRRTSRHALVARRRGSVSSSGSSSRPSTSTSPAASASATRPCSWPCCAQVRRPRRDRLGPRRRRPARRGRRVAGATTEWGLGVLAITHYRRLLDACVPTRSTSWPTARWSPRAGATWPRSSTGRATRPTPEPCGAESGT